MARLFVVKRFFCCDLQVGTYCIAVFSMTLAAVNIWTFAQALKSIDDEKDVEERAPKIRDDFIDGVIKVSYATIGFCVTDIVASIVLLCGAFQLKRGILWSWLCWRAVLFVYVIGVTAFFFAVWNKVPPVVIILVINVVISIACLVVVYSLIQEINENERLKNEVALNSPAFLTNRASVDSRELYF